MVKMKALSTVVFVIFMSLSTAIKAAPLSIWGTEGFTQFANGDDIVTPGVGGQLFDAEYLYYKFGTNSITIGLQAGFNLITGYINHGWRYDAGDLALSFNGAPGYNYAIDVGLETKYLNGLHSLGAHAPGLYSGVTWRGGDTYPSSDPFAMINGTFVESLLRNDSGSGIAGGETSYYRIVTFSTLLLPKISSFGVHWSQSCGNDPIHGGVDVPEPTTMFLLGSLATGLFGFAGLRKRFTK